MNSDCVQCSHYNPHDMYKTCYPPCKYCNPWDGDHSMSLCDHKYIGVRSFYYGDHNKEGFVSKFNASKQSLAYAFTSVPYPQNQVNYLTNWKPKGLWKRLKYWFKSKILKQDNIVL